MLEGRCELWVAQISDFARHRAALDLVLTPEEREHVHRASGGGATPRLSRALLRLVLARYLDVSPAAIEIDRTCPECGRPHGRPRLSGRPATAAHAPEFSVSHGGDLLVLAFAATAPIGVDVEPVDADPLGADRLGADRLGAEALGAPLDQGDDVDPELRDFTLTPSERLRLLEVPGSERRRVFLRHWTGKEAVLKALGSGLDVDLQAVTLPPFPYEEKASVTVPGLAAVQLWIYDVAVGSRHVCTLATGQEVRDLHLARLSPSLIPDRTD